MIRLPSRSGFLPFASTESSRRIRDDGADGVVVALDRCPALELKERHIRFLMANGHLDIYETVEDRSRSEGLSA